MANLIGAHLGSRRAITEGTRFICYMIIRIAVGVIIHPLFSRFQLQQEGVTISEYQPDMAGHTLSSSLVCLPQADPSAWLDAVF